LDPRWLDLRASWDAASRHPGVESRARRYFGAAGPRSVLDLGAGTGANTRYLVHRFPSVREWVLVDRDPVLLGCCPAAFVRWAARKGWFCRPNGSGLDLETPRGGAHLRLRCADLPGNCAAEPWPQADLVTANALFDLVSAEQFEALAAWLARRRLPLLATINYRSTAFLPAGEDDHRLLALYDRHMVRPRSFGRAMGPDCTARMISTLQRYGYSVCFGPSDWNLGPPDGEMIAWLLDCMRSAVGELLDGTGGRENLEAWIREKAARAGVGRLRLRVRHTDLFAWPEFSRRTVHPP